MTDYNTAYRITPDYFGRDAAGILCDYYYLLGRERPVLDIGVGQGRNTLFLAREGFRVDAIDPSGVAVRTTARVAREEGLAIRVFECGFEGFESDVDWYSGVLVFGLIQTLSRSSLALLTERLRGWTRRGSVIFVTAFTTEDPWIRRVPRDWHLVSRNSYSDGRGGVRTYLEPGEILKLLPGYEVLHHWEGFGPTHRHGKGPHHQHGSVAAVLQRAGDGT